MRNKEVAQKPIRVLLIDGDSGTIEGIKQLFELGKPATFLLWTASQLNEALPILSSVPVDVVLTNLFLRDSSGLNTLSRLFAAAPNAAVVVLTDPDISPVVVQSLRQCAQTSLVKEGLDSDSLFRAICDAQDRRDWQEQKSGFEQLEVLTSDILENTKEAIASWHGIQGENDACPLKIFLSWNL